jgi:hypothetical protein
MTGHFKASPLDLVRDATTARESPAGLCYVGGLVLH